MKKQFFKDFYGNTASITKKTEGYVLIIRDYYGKLSYRKTYETAKGAKIALGKMGDCWHTTKGFVA
jgi:hypothetical protein